MPTFQSKKFRASGDANNLGAKYRAVMSKRPFLMFGLPFLAIIVAGSFVLTPATAIRYEKHDRRVRQLSKEEELNVRRAPRRVDMREEYYVREPALDAMSAALQFRTYLHSDMMLLGCLLTMLCRDWRGTRTWRTGNRSASNDYRARAMVS